MTPEDTRPHPKGDIDTVVAVVAEAADSLERQPTIETLRAFVSAVRLSFNKIWLIAVRNRQAPPQLDQFKKHLIKGLSVSLVVMPTQGEDVKELADKGSYLNMRVRVVRLLQEVGVEAASEAMGQWADEKTAEKVRSGQWKLPESYTGA